MDYDDNDFRNHNYHQVAEDNNRFPLNVHSYAFLKYELDENLQIPLDFSAEDTGLLFGMPHQPDTHWIEDYSHCSSGIEFSAGAAESCSISKQNNVWSEATSSESVEMLLRCVTREDVSEQAIAQESVACNRLASSINNMESDCHDVSMSPSREVMDTVLVTHSEECTEHMHVPGEESEKKCYQVENLSEVHDSRDPASDIKLSNSHVTSAVCGLDTSKYASQGRGVHDGSWCKAPSGNISSNETIATTTSNVLSFNTSTNLQNSSFAQCEINLVSSADTFREKFDDVLSPNKASDGMEDIGEESYSHYSKDIAIKKEVVIGSGGPEQPVLEGSHIFSSKLICPLRAVVAEYTPNYQVQGSLSGGNPFASHVPRGTVSAKAHSGTSPRSRGDLVGNTEKFIQGSRGSCCNIFIGSHNVPNDGNSRLDTNLSTTVNSNGEEYNSLHLEYESFCVSNSEIDHPNESMNLSVCVDHNFDGYPRVDAEAVISGTLLHEQNSVNVHDTETGTPVIRNKITEMDICEEEAKSLSPLVMDVSHPVEDLTNFEEKKESVCPISSVDHDDKKHIGCHIENPNVTGQGNCQLKYAIYNERDPLSLPSKYQSLSITADTYCHFGDSYKISSIVGAQDGVFSVVNNVPKDETSEQLVQSENCIAEEQESEIKLSVEDNKFFKLEAGICSHESCPQSVHLSVESINTPAEVPGMQIDSGFPVIDFNAVTERSIGISQNVENTAEVSLAIEQEQPLDVQNIEKSPKGFENVDLPIEVVENFNESAKSSHLDVQKLLLNRSTQYDPGLNQMSTASSLKTDANIKEKEARESVLSVSNADSLVEAAQDGESCLDSGAAFRFPILSTGKSTDSGASHDQDNKSDEDVHSLVTLDNSDLSSVDSLEKLNNSDKSIVSTSLKFDDHCLADGTCSMEVSGLASVNKTGMPTIMTDHVCKMDNCEGTTDAFEAEDSKTSNTDLACISSGLVINREQPGNDVCREADNGRPNLDPLPGDSVEYKVDIYESTIDTCGEDGNNANDADAACKILSSSCQSVVVINEEVENSEHKEAERKPDVDSALGGSVHTKLDNCEGITDTCETEDGSKEEMDNFCEADDNSRTNNVDAFFCQSDIVINKEEVENSMHKEAERKSNVDAALGGSVDTKLDNCEGITDICEAEDGSKEEMDDICEAEDGSRTDNVDAASCSNAHCLSFIMINEQVENDEYKKTDGKRNAVAAPGDSMYTKTNYLEKLTDTCEGVDDSKTNETDAICSSKSHGLSHTEDNREQVEHNECKEAYRRSNFNVTSDDCRMDNCDAVTGICNARDGSKSNNIDTACVLNYPSITVISREQIENDEHKESGKRSNFDDIIVDSLDCKMDNHEKVTDTREIEDGSKMDNPSGGKTCSADPIDRSNSHGLSLTKSNMEQVKSNEHKEAFKRLNFSVASGDFLDCKMANYDNLTEFCDAEDDSKTNNIGAACVLNCSSLMISRGQADKDEHKESNKRSNFDAIAGDSVDCKMDDDENVADICEVEDDSKMDDTSALCVSTSASLVLAVIDEKQIKNGEDKEANERPNLDTAANDIFAVSADKDNQLDISPSSGLISSCQSSNLSKFKEQVQCQAPSPAPSYMDKQPDIPLSSPNDLISSCQSPIVIKSKEQVEYGDHKWSDDGNSDAALHNSYKATTDINRLPDVFRPMPSCVSEDEKSFTFMVHPVCLSEKASNDTWGCFSKDQPFEVPKASGMAPDTPSPSEAVASVSHDTARTVQPIQATAGQKTNGGELANSMERSISASSASPKEPYPRRKLETLVGKQKSAESGNGCKNIQVDEMQHHIDADDSKSKLSIIPTSQASGLPDLNSSIPSIFLNQPFTDTQQAQLRAQIFVYGSLIQGGAPDELYMVSAFGDSSPDGGRNLWENSWRIAVERTHNQRSPLGNMESPFISSSVVGTDVSEQASKLDSFPCKTLKTPVGQSGRRTGMLSPSFYSNMTLSSPLWALTLPSNGSPSDTPRCAILENSALLTPLNRYHSPQVKQFTGDVTPWVSQSSGSGLPWIVSPRNVTLDTAQFCLQSIAEPVQVTSLQEISAVRSSAPKFGPSSPRQAMGSTTSTSQCPVISLDGERGMCSPDRLASSDHKFRKKKKSLSPVKMTQSANALSRKEHTMPAGFKSSHVFPSDAPNGGSVAHLSSFVSPGYFPGMGRGTSTHDSAALLDETSGKVEQSKAQAENAATFAEDAIRHCQGIWSQLLVQKNAGLVAEAEAKLASAAVAAATAAAVAQSAAMAAKVAAEAALQAKYMTDDALGLNQCLEPVNLDRGCPALRTPASASKNNQKSSVPNSIASAAREIAKRRIETASAAAKRAENLHAVVRAAEIASEAVAQAGIVVAMGDPVPIKVSELLKSGPENYWKHQNVRGEHIAKYNMDSATDFSERFIKEKCIDRVLSKRKGAKRTSERMLPIEAVSASGQELEGLIEQQHRSNDKGLQVQKRSNLYESAKTIELCPEVEAEPAIIMPSHDAHVENLQRNEDAITTGSVIEVKIDRDGFKDSWFSAKVLSIEDRKAFICYGYLHNEGGNPLKEWVSMDIEDGKVPNIRLAHPIVAPVTYEGTRKRRRAVMHNQMWSVGDHVDVWIRDGWREAVVIGMDKDDDSKVIVQCPGSNSQVVDTWSLRLSRVWTNGQWVEWSKEPSCIVSEVDAPKRKHQKLTRSDENGSHDLEINAHAFLKNLHVDASRKFDDKSSQILSVKDKPGGDPNEENNEQRVSSTFVQRKGSKVVIGVPKPGKRRKFIEVNKHYVSDRASTQASNAKNTAKSDRSLVPQGSSNGWKTAKRPGFIVKQSLDLQPKLLRSGKVHVAQSGSTQEKQSSCVVPCQDHSPLNVKSSINFEGSTCTKRNAVGGSSSSNKRTFDQSDSLTSSSASKKKPFSANEADNCSREKGGPAIGRTACDGDKDFIGENTSKPVGSVEPRRSNRRIQPTSRLLEGLQSSSLVVSKMPPALQEKSIKLQQRNPLRK